MPGGFDRRCVEPSRTGRNSAAIPAQPPGEPMPKFMLILRGDVTADYSKYTPEDFAQILAEYQAWGERMGDRISLSEKLTDQGGKVIATNGDAKDGPYVESKEVVGGVYVLEADDYDHAVKLCEGHPNFRFGSIEVRQVDLMDGGAPS
jgi:hypothetical protein